MTEGHRGGFQPPCKPNFFTGFTPSRGPNTATESHSTNSKEGQINSAAWNIRAGIHADGFRVSTLMTCVVKVLLLPLFLTPQLTWHDHLLGREEDEEPLLHRAKRASSAEREDPTTNIVLVRDAWEIPTPSPRASPHHEAPVHSPLHGTHDERHPPTPVRGTGENHHDEIH